MASISAGFEEGDREEEYRFGAFPPQICPKREGYLPLVEGAEEMAKRGALDERVRLVAEAGREALYEIDRSIQVKVPSVAFREEVARCWEGKESSHKRHAWSAVVVTLGVLAALFSPLPYIALASVVSAVYAAVQFQRAGEAAEQVAGWRSDPAAQIALERKRGYEEGFLYVYRRDLKLGDSSHHAVILPHEVGALYRRYLDQRCTQLMAKRCLNDGEKKKWLDLFRTDNPISDQVLRFVHGRIPPSVSGLSRNFEGVATSLKDIEAEFAHLRNQRESELAQRLQEIEAQRGATLAIPKAALDHQLHEARERRLEVEEGGNRDQREREYQGTKRHYESLYEAAILPINFYFDAKVREAREGLQGVLGAISHQEANAFSLYYDYAQEMVAQTLASRDPNYVYTQPPFNPVQLFHIPPLPPIEIHFRG